ncbi:haloacid dehalogenase superfamily, subfamily IA, variant 3 with third motif having DD or ED/haloacid dehalogenase superfamily, subfamily IA, variant 1 with third motif having Dx(3-4)D or Dx(3-4)E [Micromonospora mirobrigensis]|uniref:Haloacid dehalogenase superfamily, subfamily IA, variant 3 with third motif having DD or ED/haloacid dehalogenase superfamily, subfamily IA, variant 1 with third motif having Dx(3-4)D or Dx(3-4)E n=1 Tax=Micromonospora mirobrigensis TaxID=262898 RepID=A0A1C4YLV6_9ACTN|nr:haloacid dehalogenase superfamily, subfamily IA, variant 3 with third motif having DD or ED/haloacid dehalogenase superfamily, subfamily IA, variant 1 with third motif having Dx(3-4)D or Dx(3-4)E [Micromonospora mirobrigensis]
MPDHARPTHEPAPGDAEDAVDPRVPRRPVEAVLLDFHGTLAQVEEARDWVTAAAATCGVTLERTRATVLADRLLTAGRPGGPPPARVPPPLAELWADRDLYEYAHRGAYTGLAATVDSGIEGLAEALYERLLAPEGWVPYPDVEAVLKGLRQAGVKVAVVSNVGFDIRPLVAAWGLADLVDAYALSYEVGRCKPDPGIFLRACGMLGVDPERTLMVGDTPADAGAVRAGCAVLVLPCADPGRSNGLGAVLDLALRD